MSHLFLSVGSSGPNDSPSSSIFDLPVRPMETSTPQLRLDVGNSGVYTNGTISGSGDTDTATYDLPSFIVISGGTGGNAICPAFGPETCHVLPVSDDGGSSSEIIRVLGGPSIGDIRSRLVRLIPPAPETSPLAAIRRLLAYRLPADCTDREAREEWRDIVEGRSQLWSGIPNDRKETVRGFLVYFEGEILKRAQKNFDFRNGSIGNYFLAAAQEFFRSLPSAIFLFSSITNSQANIVPVVVTNHVVTIAAELENGEKLVGQCEISHPVVKEEIRTIDVTSADPLSPTDGMGETIRPAHNVMFQAVAKGHYDALAARIQRLFYINAYGIEIHPTPNPDYLSNLGTRDVLVYSCGSLWTSIIPCIALRGVASSIAQSRSLRAKIMLLNSENDRETHGYTAADYIQALARTLNSSYHAEPYGLGNVNTTYPISAFVTDLVYLKGTSVRVDIAVITSLGVRCTEVEGDRKEIPRFTPDSVRWAIDQILTREHNSHRV